MKMEISSTAFADQGRIPPKYTCEGENVSPPLAWSGVPKGTRSLVLIVDDPDAPDPANPRTTWVHWVLYDLSPEADGLPEGVMPSALPEGTLRGLNDWGRPAWGGPCPPVGRHRYFFKLYALDIPLADLDGPVKADVEEAMKGHVLTEATLMGTYQKGD